MPYMYNETKLCTIIHRNYVIVTGSVLIVQEQCLKTELQVRRALITGEGAVNPPASSSKLGVG